MKTLKGINRETGKEFEVSLEGEAGLVEGGGESEGYLGLLVSQSEELEVRKKILENADLMGFPWDDETFAFLFLGSWEFTLDGEVLKP